jgi:hypothetical protein
LDFEATISQQLLQPAFSLLKLAQPADLVRLHPAAEAPPPLGCRKTLDDPLPLVARLFAQLRTQAHSDEAVRVL